MDQKVQQYDIPPPNYNLKEHATNGYSQRLSPAQVISYLVILYTTVIYFTCVNPIRQQTALLVLFCILLFVLIISSALSTLLDPTDRVVYYYKWSRHDKKVVFSPQYDKILFCQFCDSYCRSNSKHCRVCNRCVNKFDHHCMWFNNCVGDRNYVFFFISIISTFSYAVVVVVHVVISSLAADFTQKAQVVMIILSWIAGLLMAIFGFLLFNLIALHIYLNINGLTTYQFLQIRKKQQEEEKKAKDKKDKVTIELQASIRISNNKVMPQHHNIQSEESFANLQKVIVTKKSALEAESQEIGTGRAKSKQHLRMEEEQEPKAIVFQDLSVKSQKNKTNKDVEVSQEVRSEIQSSKRKASQDSLPIFFKENRSLRFLLPNSAQAQSPLKRRQNRIPTFQL